MIPELNQAVLAASGWTEISVVLKATLILASGLLSVRLARPGTASLRHILLATTFAALLMLPAVVLWVPEVAVPIGVESVAGPLLQSPEPTTTSVPEARNSAAPTETGSRPTTAFAVPSPSSLLPILWLAGSGLLLIRLGFDAWRIRRLRRNGLPAPELRGQFDDVLKATGIRRPMDLLLHEGIPAPLTCGLLRPAILLPADAIQWTEDDVRRALIHELEHVRRGDWATQLMARVACASYWFHPLAWIAWRRLALEAERACDNAVVRSEDGTEYADQLVSLARRMSHTAEQPALGMAKRSDLSARVTAVLDQAQRRDRAGFRAAAAVVAAAVIFVAGLGSLRAVAQERSATVSDASVSAGLDAALFKASEEGDLASMQRLLTSGANVNATIQGDGSPLIAAARNGKEAAVAFLLERRADPNLAVIGDGSPLIMAALRGHLASVKLLLDRGADIHQAVRGDGNALIMAARGGHVDVVEYLLERGANIEQVVPGDENALIEASASGRLPVVKLLVARGANVNARVWSERRAGAESGEWRTPLNMARRRGHTDVVAFLQSAGARE